MFLRLPLTGYPYELAKLIWLTQLRWGAFVLFFLLSYPFYILNFLNSESLVVYVGVLSFVFIFNFLIQNYFQNKKTEISPFVIAFHCAFDLLILTTLAYLAEGYKNPFIGIFLLNVGLAAVLIKGRYSWPYLLLAHTLIFVLQLSFYQDHISDLGSRADFFLLAMHILVFATWFVLRLLGKYLEELFEKQNKAQVSQLKMDRLRAVGALAAGFSHEFASPLNALKMNLDWIQKNKNQISNDDLNLQIQKAQESAQVCIEVLRQMNSSQLDVREHELKLVNISELMIDITQSWLDDNPEGLLDLFIQPEIKTLLPVLSFAQVVINLLDNANQAAPRKKINVSLRLTNHLSCIELVVADQGLGFNPVVLQKKGEPFYTTKPEGTGLGLYVTGLFVDSLGGDWYLKNDSGASVTLVWPLKLE